MLPLAFAGGTPAGLSAPHPQHCRTLPSICAGCNFVVGCWFYFLTWFFTFFAALVVGATHQRFGAALVATLVGRCCPGLIPTTRRYGAFSLPLFAVPTLRCSPLLPSYVVALPRCVSSFYTYGCPADVRRCRRLLFTTGLGVSPERSTVVTVCCC